MKSKAIWANDEFINNEYHMYLLRQFLSLEMLCPFSAKFSFSNGSLDFVTNLPTLHWSRRYEYGFAVIESELRKDLKNVIDLGATSSSFKFYISKKVSNVICQDVNPVALDLVANTELFKSYNNISMECSDIADLSTNVYDRAFCLSVLEHTIEPLSKFNKIIDSVKPNGIAIITIDVASMITEDCSINLDIAKSICQSVGIDLPPFREGDTIAHFPNHHRRCLCIKVKK